MRRMNVPSLSTIRVDIPLLLRFLVAQSIFSPIREETPMAIGPVGRRNSRFHVAFWTSHDAIQHRTCHCERIRDVPEGTCDACCA